MVTGHDPEQGDGNFPVLVLDVPVCGAYEHTRPALEALVDDASVPHDRR
jgi:hypothetical protein